MGPNGQNQHFAELRQKKRFIHTCIVLLKGLPSLEGKKRTFCGKKEGKDVSQIKSDRLYNLHIVIGLLLHIHFFIHLSLDIVFHLYMEWS